MSADFIQTAIDHVDTGSFILLTWYLMTKWIPAERALEKKERENLVNQFKDTVNTLIESFLREVERIESKISV